MSERAIIVDYFTDILCVWAWISQRRMDELQSQFGDSVSVRSSFVDVFGDIETRINTQWRDKGGYDGFAARVAKAASPYENAPVHSDVWRKTRPATSGNAHLFIKAADLAVDPATGDALALALRRAFYEDARDIGSMAVLEDVAESMSLPTAAIAEKIADGSAMAALLGDYRRAANLSVKGSPVVIMNENRQTLYGNVGYRVLRANVEELLKKPVAEASWC